MSVESLSKALDHVFLGVQIAFVIMWLYFLTNITALTEIAQNHLGTLIQWQTVDTWQMYIVALVLMSSNLVLLWGIQRLRCLFKAFAQANIFRNENVRHTQQFSLSLMISAVLSIVNYSIASVVLSLNHAAGEKVLSIQMSSSAVSIFLIGLVFWLVAKVILKAIEVENENKAFV